MGPIRPNKIRLEHLEVQNNLVCYAQDTLSLHNVLCGSGRTLLQAEEIERLSDLKGDCQELIIKADMATLTNFMMPRGKVYIDSSSFLDFKSDCAGSLTGVDLYIDVSKNLDSKTINLPVKDTKFDRMFITGANELKVPGSLVARIVELTNCLAVTFNNSNIGQLKYDTDSLTNVQNQGKLTFEGRSHATVGSIFSKGYNQVSFWASAEVIDLDNSGLCNVRIFDDFTASILKLNLDINQKDSALTSNEHGFWGLSVHNKGDKQVKIETILAKCNRFEIKGAVNLGKVICQPIDKYHNLLEVDSQHLGQTIIESFFAGYDHDIAIDKNTGKISLIQSINRALKDSTIIANLQDCNLSNHLVIRAGSGLSFQGAIEVINGDIELFTLFGQLSARGSLKAQNLIQLIAEKGEIDLSAELNARTVVTYAGTSEYVKDSVIKAESFLATVVGSYVQFDSSISAAGIKIVSQDSDIMLVASRLHAINLELQAANELRMRQNNLQTNSGLLQGKDVLVDETDILLLGSILEFKDSKNVGLIGDNTAGDNITGLDNSSSCKVNMNYWYSDDDMESIGTQLLSRLNNRDAISINPEKQYKGRLTVDIIEELFHNDRIQGNESNFQEGRPLYIAFNLGGKSDISSARERGESVEGSHWVAMCVIKQDNCLKVLYKDSYGDTKYAGQMDAIRNAFNNQGLEVGFGVEFISHNSQDQEDGSACGPMTLRNLEIMAKHIESHGEQSLIDQYQSLEFSKQSNVWTIRNGHASMSSVDSTVEVVNSDVEKPGQLLQSLRDKTKLNKVEGNDLQTNSGLLQGQDVLVDETDILGGILEFKGSNNVGLIGNNIEGDKVFFQGEELDIIQSNLQTTQIDTEAKTSRIAESQIIGKQKHKAIKDLLIERSRLIGEYIQNISQGKLKVDQSVMVGKVIMQGAKDDLQIKDSRMIGSYVTNASGGSMKVDSNQIVGSQELYFAAISQYLLANSGLSLAQYPHQLFTGNFGAIDSAGNPVIRCGIAIDGNEMLGIVNFGSCSSDEFSNLQYEVINSSNIPLSVFKEIAKERPKGVYIDADSGIIMGGSLDAGKHQIMLKTKKGIDILPLGVYNSLMFGGGINDTGIYHAITKIAAGLIDIDGGQIIKLVGVQFQGHVGQLKADYIINEDNVGEVIARAGVFSELKPWLGNAATYDLIINKNVVPTKLEFTETTKIELGKGKIDILYPYSSKKVFLTQKQGDVLLDQDLDVSKHELMAINAENGSILFGLPKTEQQEIIPKLFKMFGIGSGIIQTHSTHNNINVKAQELQLEAGGDVDIHGSLDAKNIGVKAKGQFKLSSDTSNFGKALEQSVVKADNWYVVADDIEINGSLVTVKDQVKLVSNNNVRILPVELLSHYYECSGKTTIKEDAIHQVVSRINAGYLNIDAGKAVDFVSALIEVENLSLDAKSLNISTAKEIFTKQVEFRGSDKWYGAKGSYSREYNHYEKIVPTVINTKNQRIVIDGQATLESAQIFAEEDILFEAKEGIAIKDGYNVHLHDYHEKKYTLMSFNGGSMKVNSNKTVKDFFSQHASVPTIIAAKGHFFGITEGKMHILGSKIVGKDIHIVAPKGLKLEASRYTDSAFTFVHETGSKLGYYHKGNSEAGFAAGVYMNKSKLNTELQHVHESMLCAEDTLSLSIKDGTFEQISSSIRGKLIRVEALNWEARTYSNKVISDHLQQHAELGIKLCAKQNVTQVFDKMNGLVSKRGNHVIDHADRLFKAYDTYKSMAMLPTTATSAGLYAYLDMQETTEHKSASIAVDNIIDGKHIMFKVENDIRFKGVRMTAANVDIEACNFEWETSSDEYEYEYNLGSVGIEVDLVNGANSSMQQAVKDLQSNRKIHHENYIKATGNLKLHLSGTGHFIGCSLEGATLDIKANNLILESVQDIISERLEGMSMHLGFNSAYNAQQIGFNVESGFTKSKWSNQVGQILGSQMVNVVVNETLELAGGIIANQKIDEDGKVTDEANLNINCSRLIVKTIHDYDEGVTLGIGASFQVNKTDNGNDVVFSHMPLKVKYKDQQRDLHGTIGQGNIKSDTIQGDSLNRDIKKTADTTASEEFGFDAVVHKSMFAGDSKTDEDKSFKKIYRSMVQEGTFMQKLANSATDIAGNIKDTGRNLVLGGAKLINIFGGQINRDLLDQKLHELIGKDIHTGIDVKEQERHIAKIQREIDELSESEDLDYERESDREHAYNKIAYVALFNQLEEAIKENR
jgi:hypothetical protein